MITCYLQFWSWRRGFDLAWLVFLLFILRHFWLKKKCLKQAQSWLVTKGRITQLEWTKDGHQLWPKIEYIYWVGDKEWHGEYLFLDTSHNTPSSQYSRHLAYRVAMAYEKEEEIDIYYNPNNLQQAALDVTIPRKLTFIIGLVIGLIALTLISAAYTFFFCK